MGLGSPTYSLTIPSLYDWLELDCRIYHPRNPRKPNGELVYNKAAMLSHPYAPMGGNYDNPVNDALGGELLKAGYIVGTFNFRGVAGSNGRTTWTGKAELADYLSFHGFLLCYLAHLADADGSPDTHTDPELYPLAHEQRSTPPGRIILGGYSYGSVMARYSPDAAFMARQFAMASSGSVESEITLRAAHLARLHIEESSSSHRARSSLGASPKSVAIGGLESGDGHRASRDSSRHSLDVERILRKVEKFKHRQSQKPPSREEGETSLTLSSSILGRIVAPETCYLLISPTLGWVLSSITAFSRMRFESKVGALQAASWSAELDAAKNLTHHRTLLIFGGNDTFMPRRTYQSWAVHLQSLGQADLSFEEIPAAGHFWREEGVLMTFKATVKTWIVKLDP